MDPSSGYQMSRILCAAALVLAAPLMTACGCSAPDSWVSEFSGRLGHTTPPAGMAESDSGAVFVTLVERGDGEAYDGVTVTIALRGLRSFGDSVFLRDRSTGSAVLTSGYGYYWADSVVYRTHSYHHTGLVPRTRFWEAVEGGRMFLELRAASLRDTAGIRLVRRQREGGRCT